MLPRGCQFGGLCCDYIPSQFLQSTLHTCTSLQIRGSSPQCITFTGTLAPITVLILHIRTFVLVVKWQLVYKEPLYTHDSVSVEVTVHLCRLPSGGHLRGSCVATSHSCHEIYHIMAGNINWCRIEVGSLAVEQSITKFTTT